MVWNDGSSPVDLALLTYSVKPRGGVVHALRLAEELMRIGQRVHLYALGPPDSFYRPVHVPFTIIQCPVSEGESLEQKVERYIDTYYRHFMGSPSGASHQLYHAQDCISANALLRLREARRIPFFVRTVHHVDDFSTPALVRCQERSIIEPDYLFVVSRLWQEILNRDFHIPSRIVLSGVDVARFAPPRREKERRRVTREAKAELGVEGRAVLLTVGGIEPRKNTVTILRALPLIIEALGADGRRPKWLIAGGASFFDHRGYREQFFEEVNALGLREGDDFTVLGPVSEEEMERLYRAADCFVLPSVREGWGLAVMEALAAGVPVVASAIEPFIDYLRHEENALLVPPMEAEPVASAVIAVLRNPELARRLSENGLKTAGEYSWAVAARQHVNAYLEILEKEGMGPASSATSRNQARRELAAPAGPRRT